MPIIKYKPTTPGRRNMTTNRNLLLSKNRPLKSLSKILKKKSGRNNTGRITVRHQGGREKRRYRMIDFKRKFDGVYGKVASIEYDPNRTANIALIHYLNGKKSYILAPDTLKINDQIVSDAKTLIKVGNCLELGNIPTGFFIHNIELTPNKGAQIIRSAGTRAKILGFTDDKKFAIVKLNSGQSYKINSKCRATIGIVSNLNHNLVKYGKAGRNRHRGIRPTVRGSAMNPNDHPHGGGEGRTGIGRKTPLTPWGKKAFGVKTRIKNKKSNKFIVKNTSRR